MRPHGRPPGRRGTVFLLGCLALSHVVPQQEGDSTPGSPFKRTPGTVLSPHAPHPSISIVRIQAEVSSYNLDGGAASRPVLCSLVVAVNTHPQNTSLCHWPPACLLPAAGLALWVSLPVHCPAWFPGCVLGCPPHSSRGSTPV